MDIKRITMQEAEEIMENKKPLGLFYVDTQTRNRYVGIDNRTGKAWVWDFKHLWECKKWLREG